MIKFKKSKPSFVGVLCLVIAGTLWYTKEGESSGLGAKIRQQREAEMEREREAGRQEERAAAAAAAAEKREAERRSWKLREAARIEAAREEGRAAGAAAARAQLQTEINQGLQRLAGQLRMDPGVINIGADQSADHALQLLLSHIDSMNWRKADEEDGAGDCETGASPKPTSTSAGAADEQDSDPASKPTSAGADDRPSGEEVPVESKLHLVLRLRGLRPGEDPTRLE